MHAPVLMYSTPWCPYCVRARRLLDSKGVRYTDINVNDYAQGRQEMQARGGGQTVPQIWIGEHYVGGCDEMHALERAGKLDALLFPASTNQQGATS
ncbi:MAG TPA: glutaredoxin 3 [Pseudomonadales bacterium]|jgi:glutaredoxin 3